LTKQELQQYRWSQLNIRGVKERLERLRFEAARVTTRLSAEPKSRSGYRDRLASLVAQIADLETKYADELKAAYEAQAAVEAAVESLPERERYLIRARYIDGKPWERICVDMSYSWQHTHRIHATALQLLAEQHVTK